MSNGLSGGKSRPFLREKSHLTFIVQCYEKLVLPCVLAFLSLAADAATQQYLWSAETILRGVYYPGLDHGTNEIYLFPLAATETALAFASCPFITLPDGSGEEGTACHIEWLQEKDGLFQPDYREEVSGCTIMDYWNIDCPDFTAEGMTFWNLAQLMASLRKTYPLPADLFKTHTGVTTKLVPLSLAVTAELEEKMQMNEYDANRLQYSFAMLDGCGNYAGDSAVVKACERVMDEQAGDRPVIGVMGMVTDEYGVVCAIDGDWSVPACGRYDLKASADGR